MSDVPESSDGLHIRDFTVLTRGNDEHPQQQQQIAQVQTVEEDVSELFADVVEGVGTPKQKPLPGHAECLEIMQQCTQGF